MNNISPINLNRLEMLTGGIILDYFTEENSDVTTLTVRTTEGLENKVEINKQDIDSNFKLVKATVAVKQGSTWNDIWETFSARYDLGLVKNVDYTPDNTVVDLSSTNNVILTVKPGSLLYKGQVTVTVQTEPKELLASGLKVVGVVFQTIIAKGLLAIAKPFAVSSPAFTRNQLSAELMTVIREKFKDNRAITPTFLDELAASRIIKYQTFQRPDEKPVVKVYLKDYNNNLNSISVIPFDEKDRPVNV